MSVSPEIADVQITTQTQSITRAGFGTPLIFGYHTAWGNFVRSYTSPEEAIEDGFNANDPIIRCMRKIFAQNPSPPKVKVGRRLNPPLQNFVLTPTSLLGSALYTVDITRPDGTIVSAMYTSPPGGGVVADIVNALEAQLLAATPALTLVPSATPTTLGLSALAGGPLHDLKVSKNLSVQNTTAVGVDLLGDYERVKAEDSDFYGVCLSSNSSLEITTLAPVLAAEDRLFAVDSMDGGIRDSVVTNDLFSALSAAKYTNTVGLFVDSALEYAGAAWLGAQLPQDPGSTTWAFKGLASVVPANLNSGEKTAVETKGGNTYTTQNQTTDITMPGKTFSGEFIGIVRVRHFLTSRMGEAFFGLLVNNGKIPYTDVGIDLIRNAVLGVLTAQPPEVLDPDSIEVSVPLVAETAADDRRDRILRDIKFFARLSGAVHMGIFRGTLTV